MLFLIQKEGKLHPKHDSSKVMQAECLIENLLETSCWVTLSWSLLQPEGGFTWAPDADPVNRAGFLQ